LEDRQGELEVHIEAVSAYFTHLEEDRHGHLGLMMLLTCTFSCQKQQTTVIKP